MVEINYDFIPVYKILHKISLKFLTDIKLKIKSQNMKNSSISSKNETTTRVVQLITF